jgi:hypothetical protein
MEGNIVRAKCNELFEFTLAVSAGVHLWCTFIKYITSRAAMRTAALTGLLMLQLPDASAFAPADPATAQTSMRARLTDTAIRDAVRSVLAETPAAPRPVGGQVLSGERGTSFAHRMDEARTPSCWRPDALKHQPASIGPIGLGGLLALPFLAAAVVRGKCNP